MSRSVPLARIAVSALAVLVLAVGAGSAGCRKDGGPAPSSEARYRFRAEVVKLPAAQAARPQVTLRHESIPDFRDASGAVVGMDAMVMPFDVAPSASLAGVAVGDKLEVELAADWTKPSFAIVSARQLPPDTALDFTSRSKR